MLCRRFPCTVDNCKKEYRTQWELNSHQRLKHSHNYTMEEFVVEGEENMSNLLEEDGKLERSVNTTEDKLTLKKTNTSPKPKKRRSNQQIIYVMPGPVEDVNFHQTQLYGAHTLK